jgi:predicted Zn-dependent protease
MMFRWKKVLPLLVGLLASGLLVNCATNPVTGEQDLALMSEEKELSLGAKNHPEILKQYGVYDNPVLQAYVNRIGQQLAKHSHRSNLKYTFTVLDSPEVNAFALPGGYIYITRGIMAYINSEAELAAVLGHELGHVTARHGVQQYSKAMATSIGMTLATIFVPELQTDVSQQLMNILGNALLSGYGREHELEADRLGAEYLARTSYEPRAMTDVIGILKNQEEFEKERAQKEGREPRVYHGVFASHPSADTRLQQVVAAADQYKKDGTKPGRLPGPARQHGFW